VPAVALVVAPLLLLLHPASTANPSRPAAVIAVAKLRFICCTTSFRSMTPRDRATGAGCVAWAQRAPRPAGAAEPRNSSFSAAHS